MNADSTLSGGADEVVPGALVVDEEEASSVRQSTASHFSDPVCSEVSGPAVFLAAVW